MADQASEVQVSLEVGKTRTFAVVVAWPGWCRSGRDEASALQTLCNYGRRYAEAIQAASLPFHPPSDVSELVVVGRLKGNATTDFGAPDAALPDDTKPVDSAELARWQAILQACWHTFDHAVEAANGKALKKGPRGGGRDLAEIIQHLQMSDIGYLKSLGGTWTRSDDESSDVLSRLRETILSTLSASAQGEIPTRGARGGVRWPARYFARRLAWHVLDHAWEIEDRII